MAHPLVLATKVCVMLPINIVGLTEVNRVDAISREANLNRGIRQPEGCRWVGALCLPVL